MTTPTETLRDALGVAIDLAEEGWGYASDCFREKWGCAARLAELRAVLAAPAPPLARDAIRELLAAHVADWREAARIRNEELHRSPESPGARESQSYGRGLLRAAELIEALLASPAQAQEPEAPSPAEPAPTQDEEIARLRAALAASRSEVAALREALREAQYRPDHFCANPACRGTNWTDPVAPYRTGHDPGCYIGRALASQSEPAAAHEPKEDRDA